MAVVAKVVFDVDAPHIPKNKGEVAILKLYDRRFASGLRKGRFATPVASVAEEEEFRLLVSYGKGHKAEIEKEATTQNGSHNGGHNGALNGGDDSYGSHNGSHNLSHNGGQNGGQNDGDKGGEKRCNNGNHFGSQNGGQNGGDKGDGKGCNNGNHLGSHNGAHNGNDNGQEAEAGEEDDESESDTATPGEKLREIHDMCLEYHASEYAVYSRLHDLQGTEVPRFYSSLWLDPDYTSSSNSQSNPDISIPGILIEYIDGVSLEDTETLVPREHWHPICNASMVAVNKLGDYDVLNEDVRPENILIRNADYSVVMIDFAQARLRRDDECWQEWKECKWMQDEEGAIGYVMGKKLGYDYCKTKTPNQGSMRYFVWAEDMVYFPS